MKGARILLLDDNREARWPLARVLRTEGAQVTEADDGTDGLRLLERGTFDLIIADVCMPRLGGFGLFSQLRFGEGGETDLPHRELPIILITGEVTRGDLARGLDAGLDDFVAKPVDLEEFRGRVRAALRRAQARAKPSARTQGDVRDLPVSALTQALHIAARSGRLCIRSGTAYGVIDFQRGRITNANYTAPGFDMRGEDAAMLVLGMTEGTFEVLPVPETASHSVTTDTDVLLVRALAHASAQGGDPELAPRGPEPKSGPITASLPPPLTLRRGDGDASATRTAHIPPAVGLALEAAEEGERVEVDLDETNPVRI